LLRPRVYRKRLGIRRFGMRRSKNGLFDGVKEGRIKRLKNSGLQKSLPMPVSHFALGPAVMTGPILDRNLLLFFSR